MIPKENATARCLDSNQRLNTHLLVVLPVICLEAKFVSFLGTRRYQALRLCEA